MNLATELRRRWLNIIVLIEALLFLFDGVFGGNATALSVILIVIGLVDAVAFLDLRRAHPVSTVDALRLPSVAIGQAAAIPNFVQPLWIEYNSAVHDLLDFALCVASGLGLILSLLLVGKAISARPRGALSLDPPSK